MPPTVVLGASAALDGEFARAQLTQLLSGEGVLARGVPGGRYATRVAPAKGIWSIGAIRTAVPGRGAWIIRPPPM